MFGRFVNFLNTVAENPENVGNFNAPRTGPHIPPSQPPSRGSTAGFGLNNVKPAGQGPGLSAGGLFGGLQDMVNASNINNVINAGKQQLSGLSMPPHPPPPQHPQQPLFRSGNANVSNASAPASRRTSVSAAPPPPAALVGAGDVDMSGLTEEEKRQIAAVMQRANQMAADEPPPAPLPPQPHPPTATPMFRPPAFSALAKIPLSPAPTQPVAMTSQRPPVSAANNFMPASSGAAASISGWNFNTIPATTASAPAKSVPADPFQSLRMPEKVTTPPAPTPVAPVQPARMLPVPPVQSGPPAAADFSLRTAHIMQQNAFDKDIKTRAFRQDRQDRSLSSEGSITSQDSFMSADSFGAPPSTAAAIAPLKTSSAQSEKCPICQETDLKIVVVHGKPQPLIGQLCARCALIVCSKCGKVKKDSQNKKAFWMCAQCADIPWEPSDLREPDPPRPVDTPPAVYIAPLTHLVTADNKVCSEAVRTSPSSFHDEPEYMLPGHDDTLPEPPPDLYPPGDWDDVPTKAYPKFDLKNLDGNSYQPSLFHRLPDDPMALSPGDDGEELPSPEPGEFYPNDDVHTVASPKGFPLLHQEPVTS
ncbi:palladin-like [Paramacrobiotus metropolitanus]|uniref:palladin-like n=1 Tax=Paramacrobiotus metropolitanus TaxID=2943436 RepID=UPI002445A8FE|nr:palladin-like [Paramacrobiotus metropolitanus]